MSWQIKGHIKGTLDLMIIIKKIKIFSNSKRNKWMLFNLLLKLLGNFFRHLSLSGNLKTKVLKPKMREVSNLTKCSPKIIRLES